MQLLWIAITLFVLSLVLWRQLPRSRGRFRSTCIFLLLWAISTTLHFSGATEVSMALFELAALHFVAALIFEVGVYRARLPHLAVEGVIVAGYATVLVHMLVRVGVNVTGIFATSAVATAVLGLSLQDMLSNIAGGIALELEDEISVGDYIRCGEAAGWVRHIRLRHTAIDTPDGDSIVLPNSFLTRSPVTIFSRARRHFIPFTMPYMQNPDELVETVTAGLRSSPIPGICGEPQPRCIVRQMAPGHIEYAAVVWMLEPGHEPYAVSEVINRIYFALGRAGIQPAEISSLLELKQAVGGQGMGANPVDVLRTTPIFRLLDDGNLFELGARLHHLSFAPGEVIIRQGESGDSMYIVTAGEVSINLVNPAFGERQVSVVGPGDFFGETSLLTGEARNANAVALSRVDCYCLEKAGLENVMAKHPELAEDMSVVLAHRQMELSVTRESLDREAALRREAENQLQLLARIRRFFGLNDVTSEPALSTPRQAGPRSSAAPSRRG